MWEYEIAQAVKKATVGAQNKAVDLSAMTVGIIENANPLTVSVFGGQGMYDEKDGEIILTRTFSEYYCAEKNCSISGVHGSAVCNGKHCHPDIKKGTEVLIAPIGNNKIAVIDLIGGM